MTMSLLSIDPLCPLVHVFVNEVQHLPDVLRTLELGVTVLGSLQQSQLNPVLAECLLQFCGEIDGHLHRNNGVQRAVLQEERWSSGGDVGLWIGGFH